MVQFDNQYRQIKVKIVYYGPAQGGKTTCLQHIHRVTDPHRRTKLYSLNTASDRTLFFDLLSLNLGRIRGYRLAVQLYTVPGQVQYNATRRAVLSGADGVVFVADSQVSQREANVESLDNLRENLTANGLEFETIPMVLQYNKRDLEPLLEVSDMEQALNLREEPSFATVAITGEGVMETFAAVSERTLASVAAKLGVGASEQAVQRLQDQVRQELSPFLEAAAVQEAANDVAVTTPLHKTAPNEALSEEALVSEAVRANLAMTDLNTRLDFVSRQLERKVDVLTGIAEFGETVAELHDPGGVLRALLDRAVQLLGVDAAAVLLVPRSGPLREELRHALDSDPLLATADEAGEPLAVSLVEQREPRLFVRQLDGQDDDDSFQLSAVEAAGYGSAVFSPMVAQDRIVGVLTAYTKRNRPSLDDDSLQLASLLSSSAAIAYTAAEAWRQLEEFNRELEGQVADRTDELRKSLDRVQRLADDLQEKNSLLETTYHDLAELDRLKDDLISRVSKELKAPVSSVLNAAKVLADQTDDLNERGGRFVSIIRDEAEKLSELIQSVIQASMLAAASDRPDVDHVPVEDLLRKAIAPLRELAERRDVRLNVMIPSGLKTILCEPDSTETALRAVVKNAIEFNQDGGSVKLEVRRVTRGNEPWIMIKVTDTGVGIPQQDLERVFESFWQGGNSPSDRPRGIGLGLTIAKRIIESHGGAIIVTSEVGEGTELTLSVPQPTE